MTICGFLFIAAGGYVFYWTVKQVPKIYIDHTKIRLKTVVNCKEIFWEDIKRIKFTGKKAFIPKLNNPTECMTIFLREGNNVHIFDQYYSNTHLIKQYIKSFYEKGAAPVTLTEKKINFNEIPAESFTVIKGKIPGIETFVLIAGIPVLVLFLVIGKPPDAKAIVIAASVMYLFYFFINCISCNYVGVSEKYILIKKLYLPWIKRVYAISDIKEIVFDTGPKSPNFFRIIHKSFKTKGYAARSLRDADWLRLKKLLRSKGLKVRNELMM